MTGDQGKVIGERPRPRVLVSGMPVENLGDVSRLIPTIASVEDVLSVDQAEWDAIISGPDHDITADVSPDLFVLDLGGPWYGRIWAQGERVDGYLEREDTTLGTMLVVPPELPTDIDQLVHTDLVPKESELDKHQTVHWWGASAQTYSVNTFVAAGRIRPFLTTRSGAIIAGLFTPQQTKPIEYWFLPDYATPSLWIKVALAHWRRILPDTFPQVGEWRTDVRWQTDSERRARTSLDEAQRDRAATLRELDKQVANHQSALASAVEAADGAERLLLTSQGDALVDAVTTLLTELGFVVQDMDEVFPEGSRREDLRVTHGLETGWEAIVEVRGYARGAKLSDFQRLMRFALLYVNDEGKEASACWYIVNSELGEDPGTRNQPLASHPDEVRAFATDYHGLVVASTELFQLWMAVRDGRLTADEAARALIESSGTFGYREPRPERATETPTEK